MLYKEEDVRIGLIEIPGEICLCIPITGCTNNCQRCHSPEYRERKGLDLLSNIDNILISYKDKITCVILMGGEDESWLDLALLCSIIKIMYSLKVAIYSGKKELPEHFYQSFDYVKTGPYIERLGGIDKRTTNQRLVRCADRKDITYKFWREL